MEKRVLDRRLAQLRAEGVRFECSASVGQPPEADAGREGPLEPGEERGVAVACAPDVTVIPARRLHEDFDAVVLAGGATLPRDLDVPGRDLDGVHFALEYLKPSNLVQEGVLRQSPITAKGKHVIIIGGGDTGADCLGTAHRQGAASVHQLEIMPEPPSDRAAEHPWPVWPLILRTSSAHEEGGRRLFSVTTTGLVGDDSGRVRALRGHQVEVTFDGGRPVFTPLEGSEFELAADLVLLAMGFVGSERHGVVAELGLELDPRGAVAATPGWSTSVEGVFVCGDMTRGQSLIVWAIAEGRSAAAAADRWLMGETALPSPIVPGQLALR